MSERVPKTVSRRLLTLLYLKGYITKSAYKLWRRSCE